MHKNKNYPCVLTIAGSDSGGGAGIQADIKAMSATGSYAASVITAITAQNTMGVQHVHALPASVIAKQLDSVLSDMKVSAIKIGMLFSLPIIDAVLSTLEKYNVTNIVLDPVMTSKNGADLLKPEAILYIKNHLFPICMLITPNIIEAEKLLDVAIKNKLDMEHAATHLAKEYKTNVLIKGGHLHSQQSSDVLCCYQHASCHWYESARIHSKHTHGTGCTLSSAIASYLAQDYPLENAIKLAKQYLTQAIQSARDLTIGHGVGPVHHFYFQEKT
jgi:hydroxymethylpyrimidine/phosphomethylpyrimidine kinase